MTGGRTPQVKQRLTRSQAAGTLPSLQSADSSGKEEPNTLGSQPPTRQKVPELEPELDQVRDRLGSEQLGIQGREQDIHSGVAFGIPGGSPNSVKGGPVLDRQGARHPES